jgi:ribosomal-protein-alanine N-acetyltransferase
LPIVNYQRQNFFRVIGYYKDKESVLLQSKNLVFREIDPLVDNLNNYLSWMRDPVSNPYIHGTDPEYTLSRLVSYVTAKNLSEECVLWGIYSRQNGIHIGNIKFEPIQYKNGLACVGILIGESTFRGKGIGSEALSYAISFFSDSFKIPKIYLGVDQNNIPAIALYKKQGFSSDRELSNLYKKNIMSVTF